VTADERRRAEEAEARELQGYIAQWETAVSASLERLDADIEAAFSHAPITAMIEKLDVLIARLDALSPEPSLTSGIRRAAAELAVELRERQWQFKQALALHRVAQRPHWRPLPPEALTRLTHGR
jgi:hypothetical protein